ncbi:MAG TPA: nucleoside recognition domain-containing protein [Clostridium sp.]|uniref:nucleoside recognition domain-containing protein n=1 Tax=Clostridium sp. TaxID=1506 RepID=UPI002F93CB1E
MINIIWFLILSLGIIIGIVTGKGEIVSKAVVTSTTGSVELIIGLVGMMCLWCGIMKIAEKSGLTDKLAKVLKPILKIIFKKAGKNQKAMSSITMNLTANMMGLSNAATPFGIKAMEEMQKMNTQKDTASNDMVLFLVLNAACIQFLPTTVISIRAAYNSQNPAIIIIPAIIATGTAAVLGVVYCKILQKYF